MESTSTAGLVLLRAMEAAVLEYRRFAKDRSWRVGSWFMSLVDWTWPNTAALRLRNADMSVYASPGCLRQGPLRTRFRVRQTRKCTMLLSSGRRHVLPIRLGWVVFKSQPYVYELQLIHHGVNHLKDWWGRTAVLLRQGRSANDDGRQQVGRQSVSLP